MLPMLEVVGMEDRKGVGRVVGRRDEIIAVVGLEHRRVAVAAQDRRRDILGEQRLPFRAARRIFARIAGDVRQARAEVARQRGEEVRVMLLVAAGDGVAFGRAVRRAHGDLRALALFDGIDLELHHRRAR